MSNLDTYNNIFVEIFEVDEKLLDENFNNQNVSQWDSVAHMNLITMLEDTFGIFFESDDIMDFESYVKGKEILKKYNIEL